MRIYFFAASALAVATASPALADVSGPYVGIEGGVTFPQHTDLDVILNNTTTYTNGYTVGHKTGYDADIVAGYKLGLFKFELEGGYKHAKTKSFGVSAPLITDVGTAAGVTATAGDFPSGSHIGIKSLMANAMLDSDLGGGLGAYAGGGLGRAWVSYAGDHDDAMAYQAIAGVRYAVTPNVDVGLKYRYFHTAKLSFNDAFTVNSVPFTTSARGNYDSHSVLASLVYNFNSSARAPAPVPAAVPAPPPPPPPAPATQTCADGSVIPATAMCQAPPPPPPPPAPAQRGERGR